MIVRAFKSPLIRDFASYGFIGVLGKTMNIIIIPIYVRLLSVKDFGALDLFSATLAILTLVSTFQLETSFLRFYYSLKSDKEKSDYFSTGLNSILVLLVPFIILSYFIARPFFNELDSRILILLLFILPLQTTFAYVTCIYRVNFERKLFIKINSINIIGIPLLSLYMVTVGYGILGIITTILTMNFVSLLLTIPSIKEYYRCKISPGILRIMFGYSLPLIPASAAVIVQQNGTRFFIAQILGITAVGFYAFALKIFIPFTLIVQSLKMAWYPRAYKFYENQETRTFKKVEVVYTGAIIMLYLMILVSSEFIIELIGGDKMHGSVQLVPFFGIVFLFRSLSYFYMAVPNIFKMPKIILYTNISSLFVLLTGLFLTKHFNFIQLEHVLIIECSVEFIRLSLVIYYCRVIAKEIFNYILPLVLVLLTTIFSILFYL